MDSDFQQQQYQHHFQDLPRQFSHQKQQSNGLTRFRSAPSSYFSSFLDAAADTISSFSGDGGGGSGGGGGERRDFSNARPLSPETENIFSSFMSSIGAENDNPPQKQVGLQKYSAVQSDFAVCIKQETDIHQQQQQQQLQQQQQSQQLQQQQQQQQHQQGGYNNQSQMIYHSQSKPPLSNHNNSGVNSTMQSSFGAASSIPQMKTGMGGGVQTLTRHSSSPAGFFSNLNIEGYGTLGGSGNYVGNDQMNFSSGLPSSTTEIMNSNSDVGTKRLRMNNLDEKRFNNPRNNDRNYDFSMSSWDDSILSETFEDTKTLPELNSSENQSGEGKNRPPPLTHHLSLPKTLPELSNIENFLQFQDTVPCKIRAKRGFATHPRSIAERVRRTRISERMRKLQDLVPNMDKQTNTADMLDLAVEYIKDLQKQVETLTDNQAKCTCT